MTSKLSKTQNKFNTITIGIIITLLSIMPVFAADDKPDGLTTLLIHAITAIRTVINTIFDPICVLALGICIVILVLGRNSKSAESSMSWAKRIVICFVIFNIAGTILTFLTGAFNGTGLDKAYTTMITLPILF